MKKFTSLFASALLLGAGVSLAQELGQETKKQPAAREQGSADQKASRADQEIAAVKLAACRNEIELAKFAQQKSQNEQVRQFAAKMIKDHGAACEKLEMLAGPYAKVTKDSADRPAAADNTKPDLTKPDPERAGAVAEVQTGREGVRVDINTNRGAGALNWVAIHQEMADQCRASAMKELGAKEGQEFDHCYIGMQIGAHQKMLDADRVFSKYVSTSQRDEIEKCIEMTTAHLKEAKSIMESEAVAGKTAAKTTSKK